MKCVLFYKFLFDEFERRPDSEFNMYISFMEIYNECAYDLLDKNNIERKLEDWEKV
jgi:kinesin family protein 6/9